MTPCGDVKQEAPVCTGADNGYGAVHSPARRSNLPTKNLPTKIA